MGGRRALALVACAAACLAVAVPPALADDPPPPTPAPEATEPAPEAAPEPGRVEVLHQPGVRAYHAFVDRRAAVRAQPDTAARVVTRLRRKTQDGTDELLLVLARTTDPSGRVWLRVRLPILPNNTTGWVPATALGPPQSLPTWLRIDTRRLRATLVRGDRVVFSARVGVGRPGWPTPRGEFYIRSRLSGYGQAGSFYGPVAFGTSARSATLTDWPGGGFVGVHGTSLPDLIPGRISHGCVRMRNRDILRLDRLMDVGTPMTVT